MNTSKFNTVAGLIALALITGCGEHGERFQGDTGMFYHETRPDAVSIGRFSQAQSAAGAKDDAMLYEMHFSGARLTSLGEGKLDLIIKGTPAGDPVKVYLNMPHDEIADREVAVQAYLKKAGVADSAMVLAEGPNMKQTAPSAYELNKVYKKNDTSFDGTAAEEAAPAGGGGGPGAH